MSSVFNVNGQQTFTSNVDVSGNIRFTSSANSIVYNTAPISIKSTGTNPQIAIGSNAGTTTQGINSVAIGNSSGTTSQRSNCVAIGNSAGQSNQQTDAVAIGNFAGNSSQGIESIAIGRNSANTSQGVCAIAIGVAAGSSNQQNNGISIGANAGEGTQGTNSIAIGQFAGQSNQAANTIVLNSTGAALNTNGTTSKSQSGTGGFFASKLRSSADASANNIMIYDPSNNEIIYSTAAGKTFVIQHPTDENKHLVHACLEGPEAGVYYRGEAEVTNGESVTVSLPAYVSAFARDFTVQVSGIYDGKVKVYSATRVVDGQFQVYGENGAFTWLVHGLRGVVDVEPNKSDVQVNGSGPYLWLETA